MRRPSDLADPTHFMNGEVEFELIWSEDGTVATLSIIADGSKTRIRKITISQLDLLRDFLNANIEK